MFLSVLLVLTVLNGLTSSVPMQIVSENVNIQCKDETTELGIAELNDRSSNLKYVLAIQSSTIWSAVKEKTLTIITQPRLDDIFEKSPDNLSDRELLRLKKACNDGLKCVAVDQLMLLQTVMEPIDNGKMSVRTAITKITKVISQYTTEYHEDSYEYAEVKESDDPFTINRTVTTIMEDNKELCQIDIGTARHTKNRFGNKKNGSDTKPVKNLTFNFGTINNVNINDGTINNVEIKPSDETDDEKSSDLRRRPSNNGTPDPSYIVIVDPQNIAADQSIPRYGNGFKDEVHRDTPKTDVSNKKIASPDTAAVASSSMSDSTNATDAPETSSNNASSILKGNNYVSLNNNGDGGSNADCRCSDNEVDIASAGPSSESKVSKGYVEDGTINNGEMKEFNINKGSINKGLIEGSNADGGIINVGTVNNGPVNYGTYNNFINNGTENEFNNYDTQEYVTSIDDMFSDILDRLTKT